LPDNMFLLDLDQINIPQRSTTVAVRGAVNAPTVVAYVPGKNLRYYVGQAGGPARESDYKRAFVTQPSGKRDAIRTHWLVPDRVPAPLPGAIVVVPERDVQERTNYAQIFTALAPILASIATLYLAARR